jgi:hypothetical protein
MSVVKSGKTTHDNNDLFFYWLKDCITYIIVTYLLYSLFSGELNYIYHVDQIYRVQLYVSF